MVLSIAIVHGRFAAGLLLMLGLAGPALADDHFEQPSYRDLNEAAADVAGDGLTDLVLSLQLGRPVGRVVSLDLEAEPPADMDAALPLALHAHDFNRVGKNPAADRRIAERLRGPAVWNAYYAIALLELAHSLGDIALQHEAVRLGANASVYESPFLVALDRLITRYQRLDPEVFGSVPKHLRGYEPTWDTAISLMPRFSSWLEVCKRPAPALEEDCAGLSRRVLADARTAIEAAIAAAILDHHVQARTGIESFQNRRRILWHLEQARPHLESFESWPVDQASAYIDLLRREGELAAFAQLLVKHGIPLDPPVDWHPRRAETD